nr:RNA-directed DNA polymerase, eukaryota, reverse transcriptase zinc-binding domain protein [Tanacetum cinerariifolium]
MFRQLASFVLGSFLFNCLDWEAISRLKSKGIDLLSLCVRKVGNGVSCRFWEDSWCGNQPLKIQFPRIYLLELEKNCSIADRIAFKTSSSRILVIPGSGLLMSLAGFRVNLDKRDIDVNSLVCPICLEDLETVNHTFFSCNMAKDLWAKFASWWEIAIPVCANVMEWIEWLDDLNVTSKVRSIIDGVGCSIVAHLEIQE